jgi:hypothetical protein
MTKLKRQKEKTREKVTKKNGIKEFFGIKEPFFKTDELKGKDIRRFVGRKDEITDLKTAIEFNQNYAVIGETGTGKSSLLLKCREEIKDSYYTDYLYFSMHSKTGKEMKEELFRSFLSSLLMMIIANDDLMNHYDPKEISLETNRLSFSISIEEFKKKQVEITPGIESNFPKLFLGSILPLNLKAKLDAKIGRETQKTETKNYEKHTEESLRKSIEKITGKLPAPVVLFIDEMDRIIKTITNSEDWIGEVVKLLQLSTEIMTNENLIFVYALQPEIHDVFTKAYSGAGDDFILRYVPAFKKIGGFDLDFAKDAVRESLKYSGYKGTLEDLFEEKVLEIVLKVVKNNPRKFVIYLTELTKLAYKKNQPQVTMEILKEHLFSIFGEKAREYY